MARSDRQRTGAPGRTLVAVWVVLTVLAGVSVVDARGRGRGRSAPRLHGFYGGSAFHSFGYSAFRYGYFPVAGYGFENSALAAALEVGAIDLNIKPRSAEVFVDGTFRGQVRDFDGFPARPTYLWLPAGEHTISVRKGGYPTYEETIEVQPGAIVKVKLRLDRQVGESG